jgi:hypothetical protein
MYCYFSHLSSGQSGSPYRIGVKISNARHGECSTWGMSTLVDQLYTIPQASCSDNHFNKYQRLFRHIRTKLIEAAFLDLNVFSQPVCQPSLRHQWTLSQYRYQVHAWYRPNPPVRSKRQSDRGRFHSVACLNRAAAIRATSPFSG